MGCYWLVMLSLINNSFAYVQRTQAAARSLARARSPSRTLYLGFTRNNYSYYLRENKQQENVCPLDSFALRNCLGHRYATSSLASSPSADFDVDSKSVDFDLREELRRSYFEDGETDGIFAIAPSIFSHSVTGDEILAAALEAANYNKGQAAGILNALIASCCASRNDENQQPADDIVSICLDIYNAWDDQSEEIGLYPDMVTFCYTYTVLVTQATSSAASEENAFIYKSYADEILERATRVSKKLGGSKRRKILSTFSRRHGTGVQGSDHLDSLQASYGDDFDILHEDENVIVINKPSGMVCFHARKTTKGKISRKKKNKGAKSGKKRGKNKDEPVIFDISLEDALNDVGVPLSTLNHESMGIVHRIDRGTSGCIILAKNDDAHARLVTSFFLRHAKKRYSALVPFHSTFLDDDEELHESGEIVQPVNGKAAKSIYRLDRSIGESALLLDIETKTGRKHQVRIHCSKVLGRPIFLDPLYSEDSSRGKNGDDDHIFQKFKDGKGQRFFLHASSLRLDEFNVDVTASLPDWW
eukprot:CAMPEP_0194085472 /NCGR_PEP_ID=MMETSP0149-20130528/17594_1 /TAXON_ID=122233 /ORGANISM="Chaetoceros debilis, Strain MM31A-1" /LENGTH=530 /DNA_ID=CAMNT_0038768363 /DNA_START=71 /DNA_END=1660 /DNA_ORIENTATION=-